MENIIGSKSGIRLRLACSELMAKQGHEEPAGQAKITPAYNLPAKYVIHTVGPVVDGKLNEVHKELLRSCYRSCLACAEENHLTSIAFCCISTGVFRFPHEEAAKIAVEETKRWLEETGSQIKVTFDVFSNEDYEIYQKLLNA